MQKLEVYPEYTPGKSSAKKSARKSSPRKLDLTQNVGDEMNEVTAGENDLTNVMTQQTMEDQEVVGDPYETANTY